MSALVMRLFLGPDRRGSCRFAEEPSPMLSSFDTFDKGVKALFEIRRRGRGARQRICLMGLRKGSWPWQCHIIYELYLRNPGITPDD